MSILFTFKGELDRRLYWIWKKFIVLSRAYDKEKFWVSVRNRTSDQPRSDALPLSHRDPIWEIAWDSMQIAVLLKCGSADRVAFYSLVWIHDNFSLVEHMQCLSRKFLRDQNSSLKKKLFFMFVFNSSPHRYQLNPSCLVVISWSLRIQVSTDT